jgi:hypothetical protein
VKQSAELRTAPRRPATIADDARIADLYCAVLTPVRWFERSLHRDSNIVG